MHQYVSHCRDLGTDLRVLSALALRTADNLAATLATAVDVCVDALRGEHTIYTCGNGGSAAQAQHCTAELVGRFQHERHGYASVCLNADTVTLTAIANDYGYREVFARQVDALGQSGDVLVALSTSGMSANVLAAIEAADVLGMPIVSFTGSAPYPRPRQNHVNLSVPSTSTPRIQEIHMALVHALVGGIERQRER